MRVVNHRNFTNADRKKVYPHDAWLYVENFDDISSSFSSKIVFCSLFARMGCKHNAENAPLCCGSEEKMGFRSLLIAMALGR